MEDQKNEDAFAVTCPVVASFATCRGSPRPRRALIRVRVQAVGHIRVHAETDEDGVGVELVQHSEEFPRLRTDHGVGDGEGEGAVLEVRLKATKARGAEVASLRSVNFPPGCKVNV